MVSSSITQEIVTCRTIQNVFTNRFFFQNTVIDSLETVSEGSDILNEHLINFVQALKKCLRNQKEMQWHTVSNITLA
jgi:hypothetical protein